MKPMASQQGCVLPDPYRKYYGQLVGAYVKHVVLVREEDGETVPVLIMQTSDGKELQVEVWRDPEGNGAGHLDIGARIP